MFNYLTIITFFADYIQEVSGLYLDESNDKLRVQHEDRFVLPRIFRVQIDAVQDILDDLSLIHI